MKRTLLPQECLGQKRNGINSSPEMIQIISSILEEKIKEAKKIIKDLQSTESAFPKNGDFCDRASWNQTRERASGEIKRQGKFISSCERRIILIEAGRCSGLCEITGEQIPMERIKLVPYSCFTVTGKKAYDALKEKGLLQEFLDSGRYLSPEGLKFLGVT